MGGRVAHVHILERFFGNEHDDSSSPRFDTEDRFLHGIQERKSINIFAGMMGVMF